MAEGVPPPGAANANCPAFRASGFPRPPVEDPGDRVQPRRLAIATLATTFTPAPARPTAQCTNSISRYFGSGQSASSTKPSSASTTSRRRTSAGTT